MRIPNSRIFVVGSLFLVTSESSVWGPPCLPSYTRPCLPQCPLREGGRAPRGSGRCGSQACHTFRFLLSSSISSTSFQGLLQLYFNYAFLHLLFSNLKPHDFTQSLPFSSVSRVSILSTPAGYKALRTETVSFLPFLFSTAPSPTRSQHPVLREHCLTD